MGAALLAALSMVLGGFVYAELKRGIAVRHDTILMITIATYTFYKLAMACVRAVKQRKNPAPLLALVRTIGYADAAASVLTMQMTMIASFSRSGKALPVLNAITGTAVCLFIFALGVITALRGVKRKDELRMAKAKLVKANERIAEKVVDTYKTIEKTVVGGYARVENAFVERYLTKEDETIEEAKQRLKRERE